MHQMLLKLFNILVKNGQILSDWKEKLVTFIHRKNDKLNPKNYRAMLLL